MRTLQRDEVMKYEFDEIINEILYLYLTNKEYDQVKTLGVSKVQELVKKPLEHSELTLHSYKHTIDNCIVCYLRREY